MQKNNQFIEMCQQKYSDQAYKNTKSHVIIHICKCTVFRYNKTQQTCNHCQSTTVCYPQLQIPCYRVIIAFIEKQSHSSIIEPGTYTFTKSELKDIRFSYFPLENLSFTISSERRLEGEFCIKTYNYQYKCSITNNRFKYQKIISVFDRPILIQNNNRPPIEYERYLQSRIIQLPSDIVEIPQIQNKITNYFNKPLQNPKEESKESEEIQFLTQIAEFWTNYGRKPIKYDGKCGQWLSLQIESYTKDTLDPTIKELIETKLKVFKFTWKHQVQKQLEKHYETLEMIVKYANKHKRLPYRNKGQDKETNQFGNWINNRKTTYNASIQGKQNKKGEVQRLDEGLKNAIETQLKPFGFVWNQLELHQIHLEQLQKFCIKNEKLPKLTKGDSEYATQCKFLATWLRNRKQAEINGKLHEKIRDGISKIKEYTTEQYTKYTEITMTWSIDQLKNCDIKELQRELQQYEDLE